MIIQRVCTTTSVQAVMHKTVIIYFSVLLLSLFVRFSPANKGFEEGLAAYDHGDYETALSGI